MADSIQAMQALIKRAQTPLFNTEDQEDSPTLPPPAIDEPTAQDVGDVAPSPQTAAPEQDDTQAWKGMLSKLDYLKKNPTPNPAPIKQILSAIQGSDGAQEDDSSAIPNVIQKLQAPQPDELAEAQKARNLGQLIATIGQSTSNIGSGMLPLAERQDNSKFYDELRKQAEQPINDIHAKHELERQTLANSLLQNQVLTSNQQVDPDSAVSKAMRALYEQETHEKADPTMSYADIAKLEPSLARMFNAKQMSEFKRDMMSNKASEQQVKAYTDAVKAVNTFRGNQGAQQASRDLLSTDKALALLDKPGIKTTQDLQIIADELAKIATGGVPGEHGVQALLPNNLQTKFAELKNFLLSKPTDTAANEYLEKNKEYLKDMSTVAKKNLYDYSMGLAKGYKKRLAPDDYNELTSDIEAKYGAQARQPESHPQDDEAIKWAKANPQDPRSAAILKANGVE